MPFDPQIAFSGFLGATGVASAAFGAHYLKRKLTPEKSHAFRTAGKYSTLGALAIMALRAFRETLQNSPVRERRINLAILLLSIGSSMFSWSIFWLCLGGPWFLGSLTPYLTPLGGSLMVTGWISAGAAAVL